jgi:nitrous oxidase accessory protein
LTKPWSRNFDRNPLIAEKVQHYRGISVRNSFTLLLVLVLAASSIVSVLSVKAEARTIVVPDDYATISLAIENALDGDTVFVKRGTYHEEEININKSISLIGEGINETILSLNPPLVETWIFYNLLWVPDTAITINANDVKLQGFTINLPDDNYGFVSGIYAVGDRISFADNKVANRSVYLSGSILNVTCNSIQGTLEVTGSNITVANNTIKYNLKVQGTFNLVSTNEIGSGYYWSGIHLDGSFNCVVGNSFSSMSTEHSNFNVIVGNSFVNLDMRKYGEGGCNNTIISKNRVTGNGGINDGIWLYDGENNTISANSICNCENALTLGTSYSTASARSNSIYLNNFINSTNHFVSLSGSDHTVNHFDNGVKGNYYDDYQGNDANWDGVGDSPYTIQETRWDEELKSDVTIVFFQDNYPLMSPFDIDGFSVELPEWASSLITLPEPDTSTPFPIIPVVTVTVAVVAVIGVGLLVYFRKRHH